MRQGTCHPVWNRAGRGNAVKRSPLALLAALAAAAMLGGCVVPNPLEDISTGRERMPLDETGPWTYRDPTEKELLLTRSDFSIEVVRFTDARRPRSMEAESKEQTIYQYDPDTLLGGVSTVAPAIMGKYLSYRPKMPKHYKVELEVKKLVTNIQTGTFWSGSWGRYHVAFDVDVIARRPDSTVAWQKTLRFDETQPRVDSNGRGPSKERDRARMFDLTESVFRKAAEEIGWNLRQRDARYWKAPVPQTIPTKLNLPPLDRASGTPDADTPPVMLQPVIVPSAPADAAGDGYAPEDTGTPAPELPPMPQGWI